MTFRAAACGLAALVSAVAWLPAQTPPAATTTFRVYLAGREIGRDEASVTIDGSLRRVESRFTYSDGGRDRSITATLETALDGSPRRLVVKGERPREGRTDVEVSVSADRAQVRDGASTSTVNLAGQPFYPVEGAAPFTLHEYLIRYWRTYGRPREFAAAPVGPMRIQSRAEAQLDLPGRQATIERLSIDGPVFGRETAWVEPGGNLVALVTWAGGLPMQAVRNGYESRLSRFIEEAQRDRLLDADRLITQVPPEYADGVVLVGATVIVGGKKPPIPNATVVVRNGRIAEVGASARVKPPSELPTLDVAGMTIIAGLWDLHAQVSQVEWAPVQLAAGITTVRNITPDTSFAAALRKSHVEDYLVGPRLLPTGFIDGANGLGAVTAATAEEARQHVRRLRGEGLRMIQLGDLLTAPAMAAASQEANRSALSVASRVPAGITPEQALEDGVDLLQILPADVGASAPTLFAAMARRQKSWEPMAAWGELLSTGAAFDSRYPLLTKAPRGLVRRFTSQAGTSSPAAGSPGDALRAAREAGIRLVAGTGAGIPGSQIHRELEIYVEAGMSPADALQIVTAQAAEAMKMDDAGTVEGGKRADLVVLTGNPLEKIGNLRTARWVVIGGKLYDSAKLLKAAGWN